MTFSLGGASLLFRVFCTVIYGRNGVYLQQFSPNKENHQQKSRNNKNDNRGNLNNLPQDQNAVLHSASPSCAVLRVSLYLTTPVEEAGHDAKDPVQSRSSQLVPIAIRFIQDRQPVLGHSPLWLQSFPPCIEGRLESGKVRDRGAPSRRARITNPLSNKWRAGFCPKFPSLLETLLLLKFGPQPCKLCPAISQRRFVCL